MRFFLPFLASSFSFSRLRADEYKNRYSKLHSIVLQTYENETQLLNRYKKFKADLDQARKTVEDSGTTSEQYKKEVWSLSDSLLSSD